MNINYTKGIGLIEVVIGASIILVFITVLITVSNLFLTSSDTNLDKLKAAYLSEEGIEAVKSMRDYSWTNNISNLGIGTTYYLTFSSNTWGVTTTPQYIDGFLRKVVVANAYRDSNNDLTSSGTIDSQTRLITVSVDWSNRGSTTTETFSTYITNLFSS